MTRADVPDRLKAALIYQALVSQGRAEPISDQTAAQHIAGQR